MKKNTSTHLSEPIIEDKDKTITSITSFEDMEIAKLKYFASLKPEELFRNLKQLVMVSYGFTDDSFGKNMPRIINLYPDI